MEKDLQQLFLRYLQNVATKAEIEQVISLMKQGGFDEEWESAMLLLQNSSEQNQLDVGLDEDRLFGRIQKQIQSKSKVHYWRFVGYAASVFLLIAVGYLLLQPNVPNSVTADKSITAIPVSKSTGRKWIKLPDGSSVQLNSDSHLDYTANFDGPNREVTLSGEAFFDIKPNALRPFIIHTGKLKTTVLGTAFNISNRNEGANVVVTVTSGKVMVQEADRTLAVLVANEQLSWQPQHISSKKIVDAKSVAAWKNGDLIMDDITLAQAADLMAERYQLKVVFADEKIKDCRFTAAFLNRNTVQHIITVLSDLTGAAFDLNGKELKISGVGCNN